MSATLSRARQRRLDAVQPRVDKIVEADAAFFARFSHRSHRVRLASAAEIEQNAAMTGARNKSAGPGRKWFVVVRQIEPGIRMRLFTPNDAEADVDMSESEARQVFEFLKTTQSGAADVEANLRRFLAKRGGR